MLAAMGIRLWSTPPPTPGGSAGQAAPGASGGGAATPATPTPEAPMPALAEAVAEVVAALPAPAGARPATPSPGRPGAGPGRPGGAPGRPAPAPADTTGAERPVPALSDADLAARAAGIAALEWAPLQEAVAACTACGLCASRRQTVFGVGHPHAEWMIVGEAPGEQEDLAGEPFVGPAGQLLDQMLRALGLARLNEPATGREIEAASRGIGDRPVDAEGDPARRVFIANTLKCRPPRNRNPEPDELARCEPFLRRQVELVRPRVILLMGRFAVKTLLRSDEAIGRLRGRLHRYEGIPVIVTYHPAYLLRNLPDKAKAWEDLCFAAATMASLRAREEGSGLQT
jgi:DNA polymerase